MSTGGSVRRALSNAREEARPKSRWLVPRQGPFASLLASEWRHALVPARVKAGSVTAALAQKRSGRSL